MSQQPDTHYVFDSQYQRYKNIIYDFSTSQWIFRQWMPLGWHPPPPTEPQPGYTGATVPHSRVDSGYTPLETPSGYPASSQSMHPMPKGKGPRISGTYTPSVPNSHYELIDQSYYVRSKTFFFEGRVFAVIMNETAGSTVTDYNTSKSINAVKYRDNLVFTNVRRFVVVRQRREFCFACPIFTYNGRGTTKPGVRPEEHGIAFTWGQDPQLLPGEVGIEKASIPVVMAEGQEPLDKACRVYYGIHHPIQYNVKVKDVGYVPSDAVPHLIGNWKREDDRDTRQSLKVTENAEIPEDEDSDDDTARLLKDRSGSAGDQNRPRSRTQQFTSPPPQNAYTLGSSILLGSSTGHSQAQASFPTYQPSWVPDRASHHPSTHNYHDVKDGPADGMKMVPERKLQYGVEEELKECSERRSDIQTTEGCSQKSGATIHEPRSFDLFLNPRLDVALNPRAFYKKGRVFMTIWAEPRGFSEDVFVEPARFAVIKPHPTFSVCLRISTYGGQGTTKTGLNPRDHAAVIPKGGRFIDAKGEQMDKEPIEIKIEDQDIEIDPMSRINLAKPYTVEHNVKIRNIGRVVGESLGRLERYFAESLGHSKP